ncbi:alkanesulfonate monooxygenase SsuD/methylene tetrahydromethanopterin reductase-like flavin-dependent oxidoreductase (luciferase family) [Nocardia kruczakiae]|uniref:Alkanesulfonate monooxygenase SsuD/methylene tetrahydromethanopterin reductase-like flavin-dependent oxidoreductase (Luciferase family) n=2 Tax=Nocardia kruczakiae TaxID=261477 RepID=A0ABU1X721_9NOCA|nr:alkanesulfonate monooxygenase SsuD/methylene tetrahydromethanopterin reductase-like flavin-dependent oxidoreductase (luciferase family) [Nocardia kruczakiae]
MVQKGGPQWYLFLPQIRLDMADIVARARAAEAGGFDGIAFIDHMRAPGAEQQPLWEAMTVAAWVAARTERLRIGHLVLCDALRHPAMLAKQAVALQEASGGRFELGLGSGSVPKELADFDINHEDGPARRARLEHTLALLPRYWAGAGELALAPAPTSRIPIVIGGAGPATMALVRRYADWWNLPANQLDRLPRLRANAGSARVSTQQLVGFAGRGADPDRVRALSLRRFGHLASGLVCGDAEELIAHFADAVDEGVERFYVWFTDFAQPRTLAEFGDAVIGGLRAARP